MYKGMKRGINMIYKRKFKCEICGKDMIYDSGINTVTCGCGTRPNVEIFFDDIDVFAWDNIGESKCYNSSETTRYDELARSYRNHGWRKWAIDNIRR